jgi:hypothetical protein
MACPSRKSTIIIFVEELNRKVFNEAGRFNTVANCASDGHAAHGSSASVMEVTQAIEKIFP